MSEPSPGSPVLPAVSSREGWILTAVMAGTFLAPLDSSIVNVALPAMAADLQARLNAIGWVVTAYLLSVAVFVLPMGRLCDLWGVRRVYATSFLVFGAGSLACALAPSLAWLIVARACQAVGAAMMFAAGPAIISLAFPAARRGWAIGMVGVAVSAGLTAGPPLGGLLTGWFGWKSIFLVNVPITVLASVWAWRMVPETARRRESFDLAGAVLGAGGLFCLLLGLSESDRWGWDSHAVWALFAVAVVAGVAFVVRERHAAEPLLDLELFRCRTFSSGVSAAVLSYMAMSTALFLMPFYLIRVQGLATAAAGWALVGTPLAMAVVAPLAGRFADRHGSRGLTVGAMLLLAGALFSLSWLTASTPVLGAVCGLVLVGAASAAFQSPNTSAILGATPRPRMGTGSALIGEARTVGMSLGIGAATAIVGFCLPDKVLLSRAQPLSAAEAAVFLPAFAAALRFGSAIAVLAALLCLRREGQSDAGTRAALVASPGE